MATIVILEHLLQKGIGASYMLHAFAARWHATGHRVIVHHGPGEPPAGDVAVLHLDLTVIPDDYRRLIGRYRRVVNGAVLDISKRRISAHLLHPQSDWAGQVIVKTDANAGGQPEHALFQRGQALGLPNTIPHGLALGHYTVLGRLLDVPQEIWETPSFVVEKFLPERDERGYYIRVWNFFGDRERSSRSRADDPIIKSHNAVERQTVPVPDELRAWRARLGFDFGKFDYVIHHGMPVLLDANRTPSLPIGLAEDAKRAAGVLSLADGIAAFLR
jgi:hypothetical protein